MRFPFPTTRCDSPNHCPALQEGVPIFIDVRSGPPRSNQAAALIGEDRPMRFSRWRDRPHRHEQRHALFTAHHQAYPDYPVASSLTPSTSPNSRSIYPSSAIPHSMKDYAFAYPYTTLFSIGAASTLALLSSSYLASRAWRYFALRPATGVHSGLEAVEKRMVEHIHAANRDRRSELERFRREMMGTLEMITHPGPKVIASSGGSGATVKKTETSLTQIAKKDEENFPTPRKIDPASFKANAPIAGNMDEARLAQVLRGAMEDVLDARGLARGESKDQALDVSDESSSQPVNDNSQGAVMVQLLGMRETLEDISCRLEELENGSSMEEYEEDMEVPVNHSTFPAGTGAEIVKAELEAAAEAKERGKGPLKADDGIAKPIGLESPKVTDSAEETKPLSYKNIETAEKDVSFPEGMHGGEVAAILAGVSQQATTKKTDKPVSKAAPKAKPTVGKKESSTSQSEKKTVSADPEAGIIGVDDSGTWSFYLAPIPGTYRAPAGPGWRLATIVCSRSYGRVGRGKGVTYSTEQSSLRTHTNQKVFYFPELDLVRLDGKLWRCSPEQGGCGGYRIREKIDNAAEPLWERAWGRSKREKGE